MSKPLGKRLPVHKTVKIAGSLHAAVDHYKIEFGTEENFEQAAREIYSYTLEKVRHDEAYPEQFFQIWPELKRRLIGE